MDLHRDRHLDRGRRFAGLDEDERVRHKGELVYPNLMLSLSAEHVAAFTLRPVAHDRTRIDCDLLFAPDEVAKADFDPSDAADFWDLVNRQDWAVCASVQRGHVVAGVSSRAGSRRWRTRASTSGAGCCLASSRSARRE